MRGRRFSSYILAALALLALSVTLSLSACSGSGTSVPVAPLGAAPAPVLPASPAFSVTSAVTPPTSASATTLTLPLPQSAAYSGTATFPVAAIPPNLRLTLTYTNEPPTGLTAFSSARRTAATQRQLLDTFNTNAVYACFAANYLVTLNGGPQYRFVLPAGWDPPGIVYYLALFDAGHWVGGYGGPGTVSATSTSTEVTVTGRFPFVIPADGQVCVALYGRWATAPTPLPATPAPAAALNVSAAPVALNAAGGLELTTGQIEGLTIAATDAPATATTTCSALGTLSGSPGAAFTFTAGAPGSCSITLVNGAAKSVTIPVTIVSQASALGVTGSPVAIIGGALTLGIGVPETLAIAVSDAPATATTTCTTGSIATLTGSPGSSFKLLGTSAGTCAVTLTNAAGKTATVQVVVSPAVAPSASPTPSASPSTSPTPSATPSMSPSAAPSPSPSASPSPAASPSTSPSPSPSPAPTLSPGALNFAGTGVEQSLVVSETGYAGTFSQTNTCSGLATVTPASASGPSATFNVTSVSVGSCTITITDASNQSVTATVGITTLGITINAKARRP